MMQSESLLFLPSYPFHCLSLHIFNQELERERFAAKSTMLQKKNTEMSKKISELEEVISLGKVTHSTAVFFILTSDSAK